MAREIINKKSNYPFRKLTPAVVEDRTETYEAALDYAYSQKDVLNIALTGTHGAGKSSIWKTYREKQEWATEECIQVSLACFQDNCASKIDEGSTSRIEVQILNQILYQVDESKIPSSKYHVKKPLSACKVIKAMLPCCSLVVFVMFMLMHSSIETLFKSQVGDKWFFFISVILDIILFVIPCFVLLFRISIKSRVRLKKLSFKGANIEVADDEHESLFDRDLDEVVYIIRESGAHTIVFEDLDRFKDIELLFSKLRELNYLINCSGKYPVRFIYMIRDDVFLSKERTKFFDFIIPIVPVMDTHNANGLFLLLFNQDMESDFHPDQLVIERISSYVDEYRLLNNIYNEYSIYKSQIDVTGRQLHANKLLGLITYKNVFPSDFEKLQLNQGCVYHLIRSVNHIKQSFTDELERKVRILHEQNQELRNLISQSKTELYLLYIPLGTTIQVNGNYKNPAEAMKYVMEHPDDMFIQNNGQQRVTGKEFLAQLEENEEFQRRNKLLKHDNRNIQIKNNEVLIHEYEEQITDISSSTLASLLSEMEQDEVENFFQGKGYALSEDTGRYLLTVVKDHYYPLIKYLIFNGLIDETYSEYMGYFYPSSLSKSDSVFLRSILEGSFLNPSYQLEDPRAIKSRINPSDYNRAGALNFDLLNSIIHPSSQGAFKIFMNMVIRKSNYAFIEQYLTKIKWETKKIFVVQMLLTIPSALAIILQSAEVTDDNKYCLCLCAMEGVEKIGSILKEETFVSFISQTPAFLEVREDFDTGRVFSNLEDLGIIFEDVTGLNLNKDVWLCIEQSGLYALSVKNVTQIIIEISDHYPRESVLQKQITILRTETGLSQSYSRIKAISSVYLDEYIRKIEEFDINVCNDLNDLIGICGEDSLSFERKISYIARNQTTITDLSAIKNTSLWEAILHSNKLNKSILNALDYFENRNIDEPLLNYINSFEDAKLGQEVNSIDDQRLEVFLLEILNSPGIFMSHLELLAHACKNKILNLNDKLAYNHIGILIRYHKISISVENLKVISLDEENLVRLIEVNTPEFIAILADDIAALEFWQNMKVDIVYSLIERKTLTMDQVQKLIDYYDKPLSLFGYKIKNKFLDTYILQNYFDINDMDKIFKIYEKFRYKEDFIGQFENDSVYSQLKGKQIPSEFILDCLAYDILSEEHIGQLISLAIPQHDGESIKSWLQNFTCTKELAAAFDGKKPLLSNAIERRIAQSLEIEEYVSISRKNERVYPTKKALR